MKDNIFIVDSFDGILKGYEESGLNAEKVVNAIFEIMKI